MMTAPRLHDLLLNHLRITELNAPDNLLFLPVCFYWLLAAHVFDCRSKMC